MSIAIVIGVYILGAILTRMGIEVHERLERDNQDKYQWESTYTPIVVFWFILMPILLLIIGCSKLGEYISQWAKVITNELTKNK